MADQYVFTIPTGLIKKNPKRKEKIIKFTKTMIVTDCNRYDKKTGKPVKITGKRYGWYEISDEDLKKF